MVNLETVGSAQDFSDDRCPFCGEDPYDYVNNGVGNQKVAVTCCDLGIGLFQYNDGALAILASKGILPEHEHWEKLYKQAKRMHLAGERKKHQAAAEKVAQELIMNEKRIEAGAGSW